ncbi:MAG: metallophosphoesterase [Candidatus Heimdallarchaeota archaeon]|nr:metallophosphoesterase [Candidatus Heimdallarchaeota archaeon]
MKIGAISDIHIDIIQNYDDNAFDKLVEHFYDLDMLIIAGDIAGRKQYIRDFFKGTKDLEMHKIYVPGNHDLWASNGKSSWELFIKDLPDIARSNDWHYLPRSPLKINNTLIIGSPGWYDYSTRNRDLDKFVNYNDYQNKEYQGMVWADRDHARFSMSDEKVSNLFLDQLQKDFESLYTDETQVIVVTHIVPYMDKVISRGKESWNFFSAYMGNRNYGKFIDSLPVREKISIFGHSHLPFQEIRDNGVKMYCTPLGYPHEWNTTLEKRISKSMAFFEI